MMKAADIRLPSIEATLDDMRRYAIVLLLLSTASLFAQSDRKLELAGRIADDLLSMWSEADIPAKYSFLVWPAYREFSRETNWPRLEFIRDISTVGDLFEIWPSRDAMVEAVRQNLPAGVLKEYLDMTGARRTVSPQSRGSFVR
jgi:hypothetical protein